MQLMQRFGSNLNNEYINGYINEIISHPGSCDNVWLAIPYGYPPMEYHKKYFEILKETAKKLKENNISVSLQLSNSIGHGEYMSSQDCSGLLFRGSKVKNLVGYDGVTADYCFCWRDECFKSYILKVIEIYSEIKPDCIWIDDDFRAANHAPVSFGCFCDDCIAEFNKENNTKFTRDELVFEILHGKASVREKWISFTREGLSSFMYEIGKTVYKASPETKLGLQHGLLGSYTNGSDFIFDAMKASTGQNPFSRPGGGAYNDHDPNAIVEKAMNINRQNSILPDYVECKCPEIENLPHVAFGKSPAGTAFETSYYFANGNTDMSYSMLMHVNEPFSWHSQVFELFSKHRKYWDKMSEYNKNSYQGGIRYFISDERHLRKLSSSDTLFELEKDNYSELLPLVRDAVPIAYDKKEDSLIFLHAESAKELSDSDVEFLLDKNVIADGEAIAILKEKGFDLGVNSYKLDVSDILKIKERFTDCPVNPKNFDTYSSSFFTAGRGEAYTLENVSSDMEIISNYYSDFKIKKYTNDEKNPLGIASAVIKTKYGKKWAILGYQPWKGVIPSYKREQLLDIADYISKNALPARLLTPVQASLHPRKNEEGKTVCVSVANLTIGESGKLKLLVRNPVCEKFMFMSQYNGEKELEFEKCGNDYVLSLPSISPYSVATVFMGE